MGRPPNKVVRWMYQRTDGVVFWSDIEPDDQPPSYRVVALGWKDGRLTWK